uniref:Uncharacterized protein n=1 Tax=Caenorhabditis japonica TaxID=281687 RepID=A0A8R1HGA4_CAEJA
MSKMKIERISKEVAERLSTAQVVVSLSSALRQLIDNSIDAGATIIEIRLKNYGIDSIEVQDNGCGIKSSDFDALCKPHSTSKLTQFSDFDNLLTLGFRGEALNALCTVSSVTIFTRSNDSDADLGSRLFFDHHGNISKRELAARENGTTILVERLFETLPVRRKELERSGKREFVKLLSTVQSFAVLCPHIKILCTNIIAGKKANAICTPGGNSTIRDVVFNLFGVSKSSSLVEIQQGRLSEEIMALHSIPPGDEAILELFQLRGFVSSCEHGNGRSTSDRQFVYINNRTVDYLRVCSIVNEVYKQFNKNQYPIIVLFIDVPPDKIDVNVTPDKKTVMLEKERHLLAVVRASILKTMLAVVGAHSTDRSSVEDRRKFTGFLSNSSFASPNTSVAADSTLDNDETTLQNESLVNVADLLRHNRQISPPAKRAPPKRTLDQFSFTMESKPVQKYEKVKEKEIPAPSKPCCDDKNDARTDEIEIIEEEDEEPFNSQPYSISESQDSVLVRPQQNIKFSMKLLREAYSTVNQGYKELKENKGDTLDELTTKIGKDNDEDAEKQLSRSLNKSDFLEMKVIGQFNKGFIICRLRSHLFIFDQHASDEKYNFEKLQSSAKLTKQPLFTPTPLCFGTVQEMLIRENLQIFQANGFDFEFRENEGCLRAFLTARPEILSQHLTNSDLEEIVAVVSDYPYQMYRPVRVRNIFASKACRKSVMVGKSLNDKEMTRIVRHLAKLDQPWNCPHGRPTIRHLVSLGSL